MALDDSRKQMKEQRKKITSIIVIVACFALAFLVLYNTHRTEQQSQPHTTRSVQAVSHSSR